jgi:hypothetical protein
VPAREASAQRLVRISNENISYLLDRIAQLIGLRADRRSRRILRTAT